MCVCVCVYGPPVLGFGVLMGLSICVHVHGPTVLGFGSFHGFDGPVHLCLPCVYLDHQFWVLAVFTVLMGLSICVHVHGPTVLGFGGFHGFDGQACTCTQMDRPIKTMKTQNRWSIMYTHTDGQAHQNRQNPKPVAHVHAHRRTGP